MNLMLTTFEFEGRGVRTVLHDGVAWFALADVSHLLNLSMSDAASMLDDDERRCLTITTRAGRDDLDAVNLSGLYTLVLTTRHANSKRLKDWIASEVVPALSHRGVWVIDPVVSGLPTAADGKVFGMRVAKVNAAARLIATTNAIYGPEAARALWQTEPDLPQVAAQTVGSLTGAVDDDPVGCIRHIARVTARQGRTIGSLVALAMQDDAAAQMLPSYGLMANPRGARGWLAVACAHPFLQQAYAETQWAGGWTVALMQLRGAKASRNRLRFGERRPEGAVLLPRETVLSVIWSSVCHR